MKNKLTEQQIQEQLLAEFDALDKLGRGIGRTIGAGAKGLGAVAGGVAGLGSAIKKGYQAGKQTVGGGGANVNTAQQKPTQQQPAQQSGNLQKEKPSLSQRFKSGAGKFMRGIDNVRNYDYTKGTQTQQDIKGAKRVFKIAMIFGILLGIVYSSLMLLFKPQLVGIYTKSPEI